jgi:hypothetical protein
VRVRRIIRDTARLVSRVLERRWVSREVCELGFEGKYVRGRRDEPGSGRAPLSPSVGIGRDVAK